MIDQQEFEGYLLTQYRLRKSLMVPSRDLKFSHCDQKGNAIEAVGVIHRDVWRQICVNSLTVTEAGNHLIGVLEGAIAQGQAARPVPPPAASFTPPSQRQALQAGPAPGPALMDPATGLWYNSAGILLQNQPQVPHQAAPVDAPQPSYSEDQRYVQPNEAHAGQEPYTGFDHEMGPVPPPPTGTPDYDAVQAQAGMPPAPMAYQPQLPQLPAHQPRVGTPPQVPDALVGPPPGVNADVWPVGESAQEPGVYVPDAPF